MARKNLNDFKVAIICFVAALLFIVIGGFFITLIIMIGAGILGRIIYRNNSKVLISKKGTKISAGPLLILESNRIFFLSLLGITTLIIFAPVLFEFSNQNLLQHRSLYLTFGGVSLTLFGGGYVFIPILQELIVDQLYWVSAKEFVDGIALGQITLGPIMISAAFIGYKLAGLSGAIISTFAIFLPPALLMIFVSSFVEDIKNSSVLNAAFRGVRAAVIGMIFAACWVIGK